MGQNGNQRELRNGSRDVPSPCHLPSTERSADGYSRPARPPVALQIAQPSGTLRAEHAGLSSSCLIPWSESIPLVTREGRFQPPRLVMLFLEDRTCAGSRHLSTLEPAFAYRATLDSSCPCRIFTDLTTFRYATCPKVAELYFSHVFFQHGI